MTPPTPTPLSGRERYVDLFRGLLMAHMAFDHASLLFNAGRGGEELAALPPAAPADLWQFLARFTGVPVAPAFFFMAGFMVALTGAARAGRGMADSAVTRRLLLRGAVLIAVDALVMGLPRAAMGFYSWVVLSSIGAALILLALVRRVPSAVLLPAALAMLLLHPLLDVSGLPVPLQAILHEPVREGVFRSLYPVVPWCALVVLGFVVGRASLGSFRPQKLWLASALACMVAFFVLRGWGGYGNAYPHDGIGSLGFWQFAKYPPDLPFLTWALAWTFAGLALTRWVCRDGVPAPLRWFEDFGRVPFFFYIVHFYVLGVAAAVLRVKTGLAGTTLAWLLLLAAMIWPCRWYFRKKRERPNAVTRWI